MSCAKSSHKHTAFKERANIGAPSQLAFVGAEVGYWTLWRPCSFTPNIQSHLSSGSTICFPPSGSHPGDAPTLTMELGSMLVISRYIGDPTWSLITSYSSPPCSWSCDGLSHWLPSPVPFPSLQVLLLLAKQWLVKPQSSCWSPVEAL
jgi:hypothetical protein